MVISNMVFIAQRSHQSKDGSTQDFTILLATATGEKVVWPKLAEKQIAYSNF